MIYEEVIHLRVPIDRIHLYDLEKTMIRRSGSFHCHFFDDPTPGVDTDGDHSPENSTAMSFMILNHGDGK